MLSIAVDGSVLAEATTLPPNEVVEAFSRPPELRVPVQLTSGSDVEIRASVPSHHPRPRGRLCHHAARRHAASLTRIDCSTKRLPLQRQPTSRVIVVGVSGGNRERRLRPRDAVAAGQTGRAGTTRCRSATEDRRHRQFGDAGADALGRRCLRRHAGVVPGAGVRRSADGLRARCRRARRAAADLDPS